MPEQPRISIVGDGSMATVLALLLESKGLNVTLWGAFPEHVAELIQTRENRKYLPGYRLPDRIRITPNDQNALADADIILNAVPTQFIRPVWERLAPHVPADVPIASVAKGVETDTATSSRPPARALRTTPISPPAPWRRSPARPSPTNSPAAYPPPSAPPATTPTSPIYYSRPSPPTGSASTPTRTF